MERKESKRTIRMAVVEIATPEELRAFFAGEAAKARVIELPVEESEGEGRIVPFPGREPPPPKAA